MFFVYSVLYALLLPFFLPREFIKRPPGARMKWFCQKLGHIEKGTGGKKEEAGSAPVWVHAVSVGEVMAAAPFIEALKARGVGTVLSTITETGQRVAREKLKFPADRVIYLPFDLPFALKRAAKTVNPRAFVLVETELWPNAIRTMAGLGVPVFIVNGRLSGKSARGYRRLRFFFSRVFGLVDLICVQEDVYAQRAASMGADMERVLVTGNFKFEMTPKGGAPAWTQRLTHPAIVAGSTHAGEEVLLLTAYKKLKVKFPALSMVLVPRHPERVPEVEAILKREGIEYIRSSLSPAAGESSIAKDKQLPGVVVVDTVGELFNIYSKADLAVMGGSFIPHGGQNPLEPAYWGKPVVCGPDMGNFPFMQDLLRSGGALMTDRERLYESVAGLLADGGKRAAMGEKARQFYLDRSGAVEKTVNAIMERININTLP